MNLLKKFMRTENADFGDEYDDDMYGMPDELRVDSADDSADSVSAPDGMANRTAEMRSADKVSLKLLQPKSHVEAPKIADKLKEGCIVLLDVSSLTKEKAHRLVDFLAGVAYVMGGEMVKTNPNTIVVAPAGVDITGFAPTAEPVAPKASPAPSARPSDSEDLYEEVSTPSEEA